jgi:hypothetical protein
VQSRHVFQPSRAPARAVVRDLLGIARALYRAERARTLPDGQRLAQLEEIGTQLRRALELSIGEPDTMGHRAAWGWAEQATKALGDFVGDSMPLAPLITAAAAKLK